DPGYKHETTLGVAGGPGREPDLRLVLALQLDLVLGEAQLRGDVGDGAQLRRLGDGDVGGNLGRRGHGSSRAKAWRRGASRRAVARFPWSVVRRCRATLRGCGRARRR